MALSKIGENLTIIVWKEKEQKPLANDGFENYTSTSSLDIVPVSYLVKS